MKINEYEVGIVLGLRDASVVDSIMGTSEVAKVGNSLGNAEFCDVCEESEEGIADEVGIKLGGTVDG